MKACLLLLTSLALVSLAQKEDCDWEKEMMCFKEMTDGKMVNYCIPNKVGDCANFCPVECDWEKQIMCPGKMEPNGCKMPDFCHHGSM